MSGLEVIGGISSVITILDTSIKIYDGAQNDIKLSKTFEVVRRRLPVILDILKTCKEHAEPRKDKMPQDVCEALEETLDACDAKATNLRAIFEKTIPGESDTWQKRYTKILRRLGKGNKVEELMKAITEDVQIIVNHDAVNSADSQQNAELEQILEEIKSVESSISEEGSSDMTFENSGTQSIYIHKGHGDYNVNSGDGKQFNARTQHFGKD